jgi:hypothetical protein
VAALFDGAVGYYYHVSGIREELCRVCRRTGATRNCRGRIAPWHGMILRSSCTGSCLTSYRCYTCLVSIDVETWRCALVCSIPQLPYRVPLVVSGQVMLLLWYEANKNRSTCSGTGGNWSAGWTGRLAMDSHHRGTAGMFTRKNQTSYG